MDIIQEASFGIDGFVSKDITKSELADTLLSKVSDTCHKVKVTKNLLASHGSRCQLGSNAACSAVFSGGGCKKWKATL